MLFDPIVAIIIVNWKRCEDTRICLQSLSNLDYSNYYVVIVDNHSEDDSYAKLKQDFPQHTILETNNNLGFAGGANLGMKYALAKGVDYILLLNNDTIVDRRILRELVFTAASGKHIGMVSGKIFYLSEPERPWSYGGSFNVNTGVAKHFLSEKEAGCLLKAPLYLYLPACSVLIKRKCIEDIGLLSEIFFHLGEDVDYCLRAQRNGWKLALNPKAVIYHKGSASMENLSPVYNYYNQRNRLFLIREYHLRHHSFQQKILDFLAFLSDILIVTFCIPKKRFLFRNIFFQFMAINDFFLNRSGKRFKK